MEFEYSKKTKMYQEQLVDFMNKFVYPNEATFRDQLEAWIATIAANIRRGAFPLTPRSKTCTATCPHGPVCRIAQHRSTGKKSQ